MAKSNLFELSNLAKMLALVLFVLAFWQALCVTVDG